MKYSARPTAAATIALFLGACISACGGSGGGSLPVTGTGPSTSFAAPDIARSHRKVKAKIRIAIPKHRRRVRIHGHYISPATQSITIAVTPQGGGAVQNFNADLTPASNPGCTESLVSPLVCTISISLPAGSYTGTFATYDGLLSGGNSPSNPPTGNELSANQNVPFTFVAGTANTISVTLDGIPKTLALISSDGKLIGSSVAGFTASTSLSTASVQVVALDADGNFIIGTGAPTPSLASSNVAVLAVATPSASAPNTFTLTAASTPSDNSTVQLTSTVTPISGSGGSTVTAKNYVTFQPVVNGNFATGTLAGWSACSYSHAGFAAPVSPSPFPTSTASTVQSPAPTATIANPGANGNLVATPPPNLNPLIATTAPPLGTFVAEAGDMSSETKGASGLCQQITPNATNHFLSFWAYEGGTESAFKTADQEADILDSTGTTLKSTFFSELNCFYLPTQIGSGSFPTSKCEPNPPGTATLQWYQGGYWVQRGPYDLTSYEGQTVTLFIGVWDFFTDAGPTSFGNGLFVGNVQMGSSSSFPTTFNGDAKRAARRAAGT